jgi:hypothetical protein
MDDLIKLLAELANRQPKPKGGGIVDTAEGIEFIGRKLTKEEAGDYALINSKLTDATRFTPFSIRNVGRDRRYMYVKEYSEDFVNRFEKVIQFLKDNPDVRLSQGQKDNILYNLGVYRRTVAEKNKLEKGILGEGKKLDEVYDSAVSDRPIEELTLKGALERMMKVTQDLKKKADQGKTELDDIFAPIKKTPEQEERLAKLYYGKAYGPISAEARGLGSFNLPKLHEAGVIKLDDTIYENLKKGAHHYGGAMTFAPDPVRIWRKHFGEDIFDKMENWRYNEGEDVFSWLERNKIEPVVKEGPKSATDYLHPVELQAELDQELKLLNVYKNPKAESSQGYMGIDDPKRLMERIGFHGENVRFLEDSLQRIDPDSYREYVRTKPVVENPTVVPFKPKEDLADGGRVNFRIGSGEGKDVSGREYSAPSAAAKSVSTSPSRDDSPDLSFLKKTDTSPIVPNTTVEKEINKFLLKKFPIDTKTQYQKNIESIKALEERFFPKPVDRGLGFGSPFMRQKPKVKAVDLFNNNLLAFQFQHPDKNIYNDQGFVDTKKLKEVIDDAQITGDINLLNDALTISRNVDTLGEGVTSGALDTEFVDITSPDLEKNIFNIRGNIPIGPLTLSSDVNVVGDNIVDRTNKLAFDQDGIKAAVTDFPNYMKRELDINKSIPAGDFTLGGQLRYSDIYDDGNTFVTQESLKPEIGYQTNIGDGILRASIAKEILEGGQTPNLSLSGSYPFAGGEVTGSITDALSPDRNALLGYNIEKDFGDNQFLKGIIEANPLNLDDYRAYLGLGFKF